MIATHNGVFHADEVLAVAWLQLRGCNEEVIRTRDMTVIQKASICVDVGKEFDQRALRFDHHQGGIEPYSSEYTGPMASFGLVLAFTKMSAGACGKIGEVPTGVVTDEIYRRLGQWVDAQDNGQHPEGFTFSDYISSFNMKSIYSKAQDKAFLRAVKVAKRLLQKLVDDAQARFHNVESIRGAEVRDGVIFFPEFIPGWIDIFEGEGLLDASLRVVWPDDKGGYRIRAVPADPEDSGSIRPIVVSEKVQADPDFVFVHPTGFIAGAKTKDLAVKIAKGEE